MRNTRSTRVPKEMDALISDVISKIERSIGVKITKTQAQQIIAKTYKGQDIEVTANKKKVIIKGMY